MDRSNALKVTQSNNRELNYYIEAINTIADPFCLLDNRCCFRYISPKYAGLYGKTAEELTGRIYWEAFPELIDSTFYQYCNKAITEQVPVHFEFKAVYSDSWFENHFHPIKEGIVAYCSDITNRKKAEIDLRRSEERFQMIFQNSPDMIIIFRAENFKILEVNQRFLDVLGFSREELIGCYLGNLIFAEDRKQEILDQLSSCTTLQNFEMNLSTKTGEQISTLVSTDIINIDGENCQLSVIKNISKEKKLEAKIARLDQLHLIGEMAAGIGHEIRNPMTTVKGFLQLFREKQDFAKYRNRLDLMIEELDRANEIITEFLTLARNKSSVQKKQSLNKIIEAIFPLLQADAMTDDKYIYLDLDELPDLMLDEKEMRQVIHNLVRNGLEAMELKGYVTIKTFMEGEDAVLAVSDKGKGMEPDVLKKVGTPFFTTKDTGTGMGLPVCLSIAERHNASIDIASSSLGTTVFVRFRTS